MVTTLSGHSVSGGMPKPQTSNQQSVTQDQRKVIEDTLAKFDPQNLTQAEASSIIEKGIRSCLLPFSNELAIYSWLIRFQYLSIE